MKRKYECGEEIFSTYVEVFPEHDREMRKLLHFLHVCGGVSSLTQICFLPALFSPRMWRCFPVATASKPAVYIFSTYVEVFLLVISQLTIFVNFLHVCGGVSPPVERVVAVTEFSPRMWRCFHHFDRRGGHGKIFSTYVEVFPENGFTSIMKKYFLHVCGGVFRCNEYHLEHHGFSPRMWRCFLDRLTTCITSTIFSTYVEVFPNGNMSPFVLNHFLHVCGGVSGSWERHPGTGKFSPRMWRCFCKSYRPFDTYKIFSTYVEVFLS